MLQSLIKRNNNKLTGFNYIKLILLYLPFLILNNYWQNILEFFQLLSNLINYKLYHIRRKDQVNNILREIQNTAYYSSVDGNNKPMHLVFSLSKLYIGIIHKRMDNRGTEDHWIKIFCKTDYINKILEDVQQSNKKINKNIIRYVSGYGMFKNRNYRMKISPYNFVGTNEQNEIINEMLELYEQKGFLTCHLYGKVGTGKTELGHILAKNLESHLCNNFDPSLPGENIINLYSAFIKSYNSPLILIIDEFDILIDKLHNLKIVPHDDIDILIKNKQSWSNFLDDIARNRYPNLILILTSNSYPEDINKMDISYLRKGRIHYSKEVFGIN